MTFFNKVARSNRRYPIQGGGVIARSVGVDWAMLGPLHVLSGETDKECLS